MFQGVNQDVIKWMLEARTKGDTIKVRFGKVLVSGSCATGKTSFFCLLMKQKLEDRYKSTGLADAHRIIFTTKIHVQPSTETDEDVEFEVLNLENEISQLRSYVHTKVSNTVSHPTVPSTTHDSTVEVPTNSITDIENDIASNSETDQIPEQSTEKIWDILTFVDTGGQPEYISMLPAVNSSVMITFVVHKMEGGAASLYSPVTVQHSGKCCFQPYSLGYNNLDLIKTLISFTNNIFLLKKPFLDEVCCKEGNSVSYLSFVGTYLDKVSENDINEIDKILAKTVLNSELKYVLKVNSDHEYLIPVDNTTAGQAGEDKSASKIRSKIYRLLQEQAVYEVPYVWLLLELEIRKVCADRRCSFITYTEVLELCKQKKLSDDEDFIRNGLRFHHLFGVLLYFDEVKGMRDLIIADYKWLFNKLTDIVLRSYYTDLTSKDFYEFEHQGIFNKTLLDKINLAKEFEINIEVKESFLNLLQHLKIVSPIENSTKYFMPCLLHNCNFAKDQQKILQSYGTNCVVTIDDPNLPIEPLVIQFTLDSSSDQVGSFPRGVFCCLIVQLQQDHQNWELQWSPNAKKVFSNLVTFFVEDRSCGHYITLIDRLFFLEVQIAHDTKIAYGSTIHHEIFCNVRDALHKVGNSLNFCKFNLSYGFVCHNCKIPGVDIEHVGIKESEKSEVHITKLSKMNSTYLRCYCNQPTKVILSHKIWFDNVSIITGDVDIGGYKKTLEAAYSGTTYICICVYIHILFAHISYNIMYVVKVYSTARFKFVSCTCALHHRMIHTFIVKLTSNLLVLIRCF